MNYVGLISFLGFLTAGFTPVRLIKRNIMCFTLIAFIALHVLIYVVCWCISWLIINSSIDLNVQSTNVKCKIDYICEV